MTYRNNIIVAVIIAALTILSITAAWIIGREKGFEEAFRLTTGCSEVRLSRHNYKQQLGLQPNYNKHRLSLISELQIND